MLLHFEIKPKWPIIFDKRFRLSVGIEIETNRISFREYSSLLTLHAVLDQFDPIIFFLPKTSIGPPKMFKICKIFIISLKRRFIYFIVDTVFFCTNDIEVNTGYDLFKKIRLLHYHVCTRTHYRCVLHVLLWNDMVAPVYTLRQWVTMGLLCAREEKKSSVYKLPVSIYFSQLLLSCAAHTFRLYSKFRWSISIPVIPI